MTATRHVFWSAAIAILGLVASARPMTLLVFNASASAPIGLYRVGAARPLTSGDLILVRTPDSVGTLAANRGYVPLTVPLVKRIAALAGQSICVVHGRVAIDGRHVADQLTADRQGRALPRWTGCRELNKGEIFLLMQGVPDSFDSRYFGPVANDAVIGKLTPLWLR